MNIGQIFEYIRLFTFFEYSNRDFFRVVATSGSSRALGRRDAAVRFWCLISFSSDNMPLKVKISKRSVMNFCTLHCRYNQHIRRVFPSRGMDWTRKEISWIPPRISTSNAFLLELSPGLQVSSAEKAFTLNGVMLSFKGFPGKFKSSVVIWKFDCRNSTAMQYRYTLVDIVIQSVPHKCSWF